MKKNIRYDAWGLVEAQFEPGSRGRVLKNLRGIKKKREMEGVEAREYLRTLEELILIYDDNHRFSTEDICLMHKIWLGSLYEWAGHYRQTTSGKGPFLFAGADYIPKLMAEFAEGPLLKFTPCRFAAVAEIERALGVVHAEFLLIHPFRHGNGMLARLISILMALQAGLPPLDFGGIRGKNREAYFSAIRAGINRNYKPMERIFRGIIRRTLRSSDR